jgi:AraC family transcriptional regulator
MRHRSRKVKPTAGDSAGPRAIADSLNQHTAPVLHTSAACKTGLAFLELASSEDAVETTEPVQDDAFLIALQLRPCVDFHLYADGRLIQPREFEQGAVAIFDLRTNLVMERRDPFHAIDLYIPRRSLDALADDANARRIDELRHEPGKALQDPVARNLLLSIRPALTSPGQASELFIDHVAIALATHIAHTYGGMRVNTRASGATLAHWQEQRAKELLASSYSGSITLADLARACELSVRHFTRAFRGSTGMSPHEWLLQLRLEKARTLLATTRRLPAEIALDCGFADQSHLSRVFRRIVGVTPGAWRRLHQR